MNINFFKGNCPNVLKTSGQSLIPKITKTIHLN